MAKGGGFTHEDFDLMMDEFKPRGDDDDDQEVNTTQPSQPDAASTPATFHSENIEMQTMMHEQSGLPDDSYGETPLLGAQSQIQESWDALTRDFPDASATDLETTRKTGRLQVKMAGFGKNFMTFLPKIGRASNNWTPNFQKKL